ncbi:HAD family hydrolase [Desulfovibrio sp. X2]|uniref:HAD family hydrolase n=1 Tax=Desulfovibrio sp. X2 TaxID=941449 RepID=UPI000358A343|nr:HAD family hydrolase [Desulfovibrio sp. X2]EPR42174.1 HAD family hydrolase [Desulfovibrio sp. X2]
MFPSSSLCEAARPSLLRGLVFDCDGVLLDSRHSNVSYYNLYLSKLGLPPMNTAQEDYVHVRTVDECLRHITPERMHDRIPEARASMDYSEILPTLVMEPGLVEFLSFLRGRGVRLAVNTNRTTTMHMVIDHFGLQGFFSPVVTAGTVSHPKPHPESLYKILATWGMEKEEIAFLGDSDVDEGTAHSAGVPFWAYKNENLRADLHVSSFQSLMAALRACPDKLPA